MKRPNCDPASSSLPENCGTLLQTGRLSRRRPALLTLRGRSFGHAVGFRAALFDICLDSIGLIPNRSRKSAKRLPYCSAVHLMSQCNLTKRLLEYSSVFLQRLHDEDCLRKSLMLVLAALLRGQFLESRGNSYLNFLQPHTQLYWVKFENGRFQQSLPPRIFELRIHSPSLVRMDGRRPWWTRLRGRNRRTVTHKSTECNLFVPYRSEDHIKKIRTFCGNLTCRRHTATYGVE